jgi:rare lipoprotein A
MRSRFLRIAAISAIAFAGLFFSSCARRKHTHATPATLAPASSRRVAAVPLGYSEEGVASWYGIPYHGRPAADGEIYDMDTLVAAHRTLPFNTWLRVTNLANGKNVLLRVIDRGPFVDGRIIDLSKAAARDIDLLGPGVGRVRLEVVAAPADVPANDFYAVQVGAFSIQENADRVRQDYARRYGIAQLAAKRGNTTLWRVLVGKEPSLAAAQQLAGSLSAENPNVFIVRLDETVQPSAPFVSDTPAVPAPISEPVNPPE